MKKIIYSAMAVAMLATTSCKDDFAESFVGDEATVEFSISTPEIVTRAFSDGETVNTLKYAVYDGEEYLSELGGTKEFSKSTTVNLTLKTGKTYNVVFWADCQVGGTSPYTVNFAEKTMTVNYTGAVSNDEKRDAFYACTTVNVSDPTTHSVALTRPFAQLNIGTNDYTEAAAANYKPKYSKVEVKQLKNQLNLLTGDVKGDAADITFGYSVIPNKQDGYVAENKENFPVTGYEYLAMNYLLVPADQEVVDVTFYHNTDGTSDIAENTKTVGSVPLKRNYRTNIYGKLLTGNADIEVEIIPGFDKENNVEAPKVVAVTTAEELNTALADPEVGEVVLNSDIDTEGFVFGAPASSNAPSTRAATVIAGRNVIIDGNGKTLTYKGAYGGRIIDFKAETNGANLTLKNLTIINNVSWIERAVNYNTNGTLTLEDVTIESAEGCSLNYAINLPASSANAKVEIKNCEIWAGAQALNLWGERTMVNVTNSALYVVDNSAAEGRSVVAINNNGETIADYCVLDFNGGSIQVVYVGEGETKPSYAIRNNTAHSTINVSSDTDVVGEISNPVAIIYWEGQNQYYSLSDLNAALDAAVPEYKATGVRMINDLTLPLANKAIYGTPVAVQMKNGGVFDGCNNTLSVENPEYNAYVVETYGGTIKNLNITTPAGRGIIISSPKEDIYLENVFVNGPGYALNTTEHNGKNLVVKNSTFNGWTSFAGLVSASFTSCTFGVNTYEYWQKSGYDKDYDRLIRPYVETSFNSCVFEEGFYIDLSALAADKKVTLKDCVCGKVKITVENYSQYITIELPSGRTLAECVVFE